MHSQIKELEVLLETQNNRLKSMGEINNSNELLAIEAEIESLEKKRTTNFRKRVQKEAVKIFVLLIHLRLLKKQKYN